MPVSYRNTPCRRPNGAGKGRYFVCLGIETDEELWGSSSGEMYFHPVEGSGPTLDAALADAEKSAIEAGLGGPGRRREPPTVQFTSPRGRWIWLAGRRYEGGQNDRPCWYKDE